MEAKGGEKGKDDGTRTSDPLPLSGADSVTMARHSVLGGLL